MYLDDFNIGLHDVPVLGGSVKNRSMPTLLKTWSCSFQASGSPESSFLSFSDGVLSSQGSRKKSEPSKSVPTRAKIRLDKLRGL